ncbi:MAG TPA: hypothetical protein VNA27_17645 [Rubrobacteraceae bacterium]|nr:hypothetical protein [Rubrobacteraceae bacterium]
MLEIIAYSLKASHPGLAASLLYAPQDVPEPCQKTFAQGFQSTVYSTG